MKIRTFFFATHTLTSAAIAAMFVVAFQSPSTMMITGAAIAAIIVCVLASWIAAARMRSGLSVLESVVSDNDASSGLTTGLTEFDQTATRIGDISTRWETVAADTRAQSREVKSMMAMLNRRGGTGTPSSGQLRELLAGLGNSLHSHLSQIGRSHDEIQQSSQVIAEGAETQGHAVVKTTGYVEQLALSIDSVSGNAVSAKAAIKRSHDSASAALELVRELNEGMVRVRRDSQSCEKKLRGLCDPSRQISGILSTITDITAKTDLLALNASIESIRAGEHGSGFAIVADQVRNLAEQASDATREIASLIESMQVVTQESIRGFEQEREEIESATGRAAAVEQSLQEICGAAERDVRNLSEMSATTKHQLQLVQDVVLAIEHISKIAKSNRGAAERNGWTIKSLTTSSLPLAETVDRLKSCCNSSKEKSSGDRRSVVPVAPLSMQLLTSDPAPVG